MLAPYIKKRTIQDGRQSCGSEFLVWGMPGLDRVGGTEVRVSK